MKVEEIFDKLPASVYDEKTKKLYHMKLIKSNSGVMVDYVSNDGFGLGNTYREGKNLEDALNQMYVWLVDFGYMEKRGNAFETMLNVMGKQPKIGTVEPDYNEYSKETIAFMIGAVKKYSSEKELHTSLVEYLQKQVNIG